ncbi:kynureninase/PvdN C-terminal domain-containing protein [Sphaerisporangium fuscum]|uniref:kynureninase/PvdN C-terminal domain-containing protein n=1 Tax=Sphaerisporangium fuscum TaxID=2835868 RepID=UPI001BDD4F23|nr:hypothetical protein [Sphaerisporangium fuscum]
MLEEAGIGRVRAKPAALTGVAVALYDEWLAPLGFTLTSLRRDPARGGQVTVSHPKAADFADILIDDGVIVGFRAPDGVRPDLSPLSTSSTELWAAPGRAPVLATEVPT